MTTIKVFSWNIACMPNYLNIFGNIENRLENIIKFIEIHNPDIISLQEVFSQNVRKILYNFFTTSSALKKGPFLNVIILPTDVFPEAIEPVMPILVI